MPADLGASLLRHGYLALPRFWAGRDPDLDAAWGGLLGRRTLVVRGPEGARLFYDDQVVHRDGAVPHALADLLFGPGAVHALDGVDHRERKAMFRRLLTPASAAGLGDVVGERLRDAACAWPAREPFDWQHELVRVYGGAVLEWAGVEVSDQEAETAATELAAIVDGFGFSPRAYARGWVARGRAQRWARALVSDVRAERRRATPDSVLAAFAEDDHGRQLPLSVGATELLNVLRPTVAVSWLGAFAAYALVRHPEHGAALADPERSGARLAFAQEVRRLAPFVPALTAVVHEKTIWSGHELRPGDRVLLDVPGTNRHRRWGDPDVFRPERFLEEPPGPYDLVPQGGGDPDRGHRCPGEDVALQLLDRTLLVLARTELTVAGRDADLRRMPTAPFLQVLDARPVDGAHLALAGL